MPKMTAQEFSNAKSYVKGKGVQRAGMWAAAGTLVGGPVGGLIGGLAGYITGGLDAANKIDNGEVRPKPEDGLKAASGTIISAAAGINKST